MLTLRYKGLKPVQFTGDYQVLTISTPSVISYKYVPFNLESFIDEYDLLYLWCKIRHYEIDSSFECYCSPMKEEHWTVKFIFAGGTIDFQFVNLSFSYLIEEIKDFIKQVILSDSPTECQFRYQPCGESVNIKCPDNVWCNKTSCASLMTKSVAQSTV